MPEDITGYINMVGISENSDPRHILLYVGIAGLLIGWIPNDLMRRWLPVSVDDITGFGQGAGAVGQDSQQHSVDGTSAVVVAQAQTPKSTHKAPVSSKIPRRAIRRPVRLPYTRSMPTPIRSSCLPMSQSTTCGSKATTLFCNRPTAQQIIIKNAALNVPTLIIGDVEVPRVALLAALEAAGIVVAFGADGTISA